ncbi:MAG: hypothetical protein Q9171_006733 [Xanthocarpia ochracea]
METMEQELERLAVKADRFDQKPTSQQVSRFRKLFSYSESQALDAIIGFRSDMNHQELTDDQWATVQAEKEAAGHDRESYEHQRQLWFAKPVESTFSAAGSGGADSFLFKLREPFPSVDVLRREVGVTAELKGGYNEDGTPADFACVNRNTKHAIEEWIQQHPTIHPPSFVPIRQAAKDLSKTSCYPSLGIDSTLPQHRAKNDEESFAPAQTEYPVWYFFYGTLKNPEELRKQLQLLYAPKLISASVKGGYLRSWQSKYQALVDGPADAEVNGCAFRLYHSAHDESLRCHEGNVYEVVRCRILLSGGEEVQGLTFRFAAVDKLDLL